MLVALLAAGISSAQEPPAGGQSSPSNPPTNGSTPDAQPQSGAASAPATPSQGQTQPSSPPPVSPAKPSPIPPRKKKPATKGTSNHKVVIRNGGAKDESAQLSPAMTKEEERRNREITTRLLAATDANLRGIAGRQLTPAQQGQLNQIRTYMRQSKEASDAGDLARAHTLAYKAHLLSDELRK